MTTPAGGLRAVALRRWPPGLARGLCLAGMPYVAMGALAAAWPLPPHPAVLDSLATAAGRLAGSPPAPEQLAAGAALGAVHLFNLAGGTAFTRALLGIDAPFPSPAAAATQREAAAAGEQPAEALYRAGPAVGNLERILVVTLTLRGELGAIGLVMAAKSIVRWEMSRSRA